MESKLVSRLRTRSPSPSTQPSSSTSPASLLPVMQVVRRLIKGGPLTSSHPLVCLFCSRQFDTDWELNCHENFHLGDMGCRILAGNSGGPEVPAADQGQSNPRPRLMMIGSQVNPTLCTGPSPVRPVIGHLPGCPQAVPPLPRPVCNDPNHYHHANFQQPPQNMQGSSSLALLPPPLRQHTTDRAVQIPRRLPAPTQASEIRPPPNRSLLNRTQPTSVAPSNAGQRAVTLGQAGSSFRPWNPNVEAKPKIVPPRVDLKRKLVAPGKPPCSTATSRYNHPYGDLSTELKLGRSNEHEEMLRLTLATPGSAQGGGREKTGRRLDLGLHL